MEKTPVLGIIGGSGFYQFPALKKVIRKIDLVENRMIVDMTAIEGKKDAH